MSRDAQFGDGWDDWQLEETLHPGTTSSSTRQQKQSGVSPGKKGNSERSLSEGISGGEINDSTSTMPSPRADVSGKPSDSSKSESPAAATTPTKGKTQVVVY